MRRDCGHDETVGSPAYAVCVVCVVRSGCPPHQLSERGPGLGDSSRTESEPAERGWCGYLRIRGVVAFPWLPFAIGGAKRAESCWWAEVAGVTAYLRDLQLRRCCDAFDHVSADAPTLCAGWAAHDLAIHLWTLKHDPLGWPGIAIPALAAMTMRRADRIKRRWSYAELVARLRAESGAIACMPFDRFEGHRHALGEYFVHSQDVARANGLDQEKPGSSLEDALWLRVQIAARQLHRRRTPGLRLDSTDGRSARVTGGPTRTVVSGLPSELMCWVYGRGALAAVTVRR